jgi:hypothetical protein
MQLLLKFKNINNQPECQISVNGLVIHSGPVPDIFTDELDIPDEHIQLKIEFTNKMPEDTIVENGEIVKDKNFELDQVIVDQYDFKELIWQGNYRSNNSDVYPGCLFFGPPGYFEINFRQPVLHWILKTRNDINHNDPDWELDYTYYTEACKLLTLISLKSEH